MSKFIRLSNRSQAGRVWKKELHGTCLDPASKRVSVVMMAETDYMTSVTTEKYKNTVHAHTHGRQ